MGRKEAVFGTVPKPWYSSPVQPIGRASDPGSCHQGSVEQKLEVEAVLAHWVAVAEADEGADTAAVGVVAAAFAAEVGVRVEGARRLRKIE